MNEDIIEWTPGDMLEVALNEPDDFLKIKETLTRIGVASQKDVNTLFQSCHILHKQGHYFITHFKELFLLDGHYTFKGDSLIALSIYNDIHKFKL